MTLFDLLDPLFDPSFLDDADPGDRPDPTRSLDDADPGDRPDPTRSDWNAIRSDLLGRDGPRLADPLAEERDNGR